MQNRYEIARTLLGLINIADTKEAIRAMPPDKLAQLKSLVDWVQDYERHERPEITGRRSLA